MEEKTTLENTESDEIEQKELITTSSTVKLASKYDTDKLLDEFGEIHKLLEAGDDILPLPKPEPLLDLTPLTLFGNSSIPINLPGIKVFDKELIFSLYDEDSLNLKNFISSKDELPKIFVKNDSIPCEESFRKLIAYRVANNLRPDEEHPTLSLYVLYLMSVHDERDFVTACSDFLIQRPFRLKSKEIFPILINFGINSEELPPLCDEGLLKKLSRNVGKFEKVSNETKFPVFNIEMVGKILLHYVTGNFITIDSDTNVLVKTLTKITLDPKVRTSSSSILPVYSIFLSKLCSQASKKFKWKEIANWMHFPEEHLSNQSEICRTVSKTICSEVQNALLLKTFRTILKTESLPKKKKTNSMIEFIKSVLSTVKYKKLSPLEFFSVFVLINSSLPGVTATFEDSVEINKTLNYLEGNTVRGNDSVDLIRIKLELAKTRNLVANNVDNGLFVGEPPLDSTSPFKKPHPPGEKPEESASKKTGSQVKTSDSQVNKSDSSGENAEDDFQFKKPYPPGKKGNFGLRKPESLFKIPDSPVVKPDCDVRKLDSNVRKHSCSSRISDSPAKKFRCSK